MQQLMQKSRQRMIIVLIIALLLVNFVICNSTVKADSWPKQMSIDEYNAIPEFNDAGTLQRQNYKSTADGSIADRLKKAWNLDDTSQVMEILDNHLSDAGTLTVSWENGLYKVDKVSIKLTEAEKTKYGIATDSEGNANGDTNTWSDLTNDDDNEAEGGEDDIGGILFRPIASLICGIGDVVNSLLQRLLIDDKSDVFITSKDKISSFIGSNGPASGVNTVPVVKDNIKSWIGRGYGVPNIKLTPAEIFAGNVAALDANFFETNADYSNKLGGEEKSIVLELKGIISKWYVALRNIAIVGLLSVLLYIGIRIVISSSAGDKAKYKQFFVDWIVALCLIFFLHYIMSFTMSISETITDALAGETTSQGTIKQVNISLTDENGASTGETFSSNFAGVARIKAQYKGSLEMMGYSIIYLALTIYTLYFAFVYLKRLLMLAFFTIIAPLVALTYPLDKIKDGHAQAFNYWLKEYMFYAILQPLHMLLYTVFVSSALSVAATNMLYAIVALAFIVPAEKIVKQMFGIKGATESSIGGFAGGAIAAQAFNALKKGQTSGNKGAQADNNKIRQVKNPNAPDSIGTLAGNAEEIDAAALAAGAGAGIGIGAGAATAEGIDEMTPTTNPDVNNPTQVDKLFEEAQKDALIGNKPDGIGNKGDTPQTPDNNKFKEKDNQPKNKRRIVNNIKRAMKKRYVAAGGLTGIGKSALKGAAKGYGKFVGTAAMGAIGLSAGIVGGNMSDTLKGMGAGLAAGSAVSNKAGKMIGNTFSNNSAVGRFANDVLYGDDEGRKQQFIKQYMSNSENKARILEKNPDLGVKELEAKQRAEAEMMYDTGIDDYTAIKAAVDMEKTLAEEGTKNSHDMAVALAKLGQNYDNNTFVNKSKFDQAQKALQERLEEQMNENLKKQIDKQLEGKGLSASARVAERQKRMASESAKISKQANEEAAQTLNRIYKMKKINK